MNSIFKYNANAKYSTKDVRGRHNRNNFSFLGVYLDEKRPSVKIQLPNIFKDYRYPLPFGRNFIIAMVNANLN